MANSGGKILKIFNNKITTNEENFLANVIAIFPGNTKIMTNVCFCLKIHIPAIQVQYNKLYNVKRNRSYYNEQITEDYVKLVYRRNILPFFATVNKLHLQTNKKVKFGLSISGISLALLQKYAPEAVELMQNLEHSGCLEILSEPWSHSIVPYFNKKTFIQQVKQHDDSVHSIFGKVPEIFIVHSPEYLLFYPHATRLLNKKAIFTNFNQINNSALYKEIIPKKLTDTISPSIWPINHDLSRTLQEIDFYPFVNSPSSFIEMFNQKFGNSIKNSTPLILVFNVTSANTKFLMSRSVLFKKIAENLLTNPLVNFQLPSLFAHNNKDFLIENNLFPKIRNSAKLSNVWLTDINQNKIFRKLLRINTLMLFETNHDLAQQWDMIQDMNNLYYMNYSFNDKKFAKFHTNPYTNPEKAFNNYSNILTDFLNRLESKLPSNKNTQTYFLGKHIIPNNEE